MTTMTETTDDATVETTTEVETITLSPTGLVELILSRIKAIYNGKTKLDKVTKKQRQAAESDFHQTVMKLLESEEGLPARLELPTTIEVSKDAVYEELVNLLITLSCGDNEVLVKLTRQTYKISLMYVEALRDILSWEEYDHYIFAISDNFTNGNSRLIPADLDLIYALGKERVLELVGDSTKAKENDVKKEDNEDIVSKYPIFDIKQINQSVFTEDGVREQLQKLIRNKWVVKYLAHDQMVYFTVGQWAEKYAMDYFGIDENFISKSTPSDKIEHYIKVEQSTTVDCNLDEFLS